MSWLGKGRGRYARRRVTSGTQSRIFLNWVSHCSRSDTLAAAFDADPFFVPYLQRKEILFVLLRYLCASFHTTALLLLKRPRIVFVVNQPVFLPILVYLLSFVLRFQYVVDSHSGLFNKKKWIWAQPLMKCVCKGSLFTMVTNQTHKEIVGRWGADVEIVGFVIVSDGNARRKNILSSQSVVVIGTFAEDEPILEILQAASSCPRVLFYVTGDYSKATEEVKELRPQNVRFTGFLEREEYISLVKSVDGAMILVTNDNTMQRGAYEAMSWGIPIITSGWPILRNTFPKGALFVSNDAAGIAIGVGEFFRKKEHLKLEIQDLRKEREQEWKVRIREIKQRVDLAEGVSR